LCGRGMVWGALLVAIVAFLVIGVTIPANSHMSVGAGSSTGTLTPDAVGNLFLGLAAVSTGFVLGQDKINNKLSGWMLWALVILLFGAGTVITSVANANSWGFTYQWGNVAMEIGGAVLACAIAKTVFNGGNVSPQIKIWLFLLFLGCGAGGAYMGSQLTAYPGWGALSSFFLCASGAIMASIAEDIITKDMNSASEDGPNSKPDRAHARDYTRPSGSSRQPLNPGSDHTRNHDNDPVREASIAEQFFEERRSQNRSSESRDPVVHDATSAKWSDATTFAALLFIILPLLCFVGYALHRARAGPKRKRAAGR